MPEERGAPVVYSLLFERSAAGDSTRVLLELPGARLDLLSAQDPSGRDSNESVTDADSKERFARRLVLAGYETLPACAGIRPPDACVIFTGARGEVASGLSGFSGDGAPAARARVAALVSPAFDEKLGIFAKVFAKSAEFLAYGDDFLRLVWPGRFPRSTGKFEQGRRVAGCDFDARFGYPCTEAERRRDRSLTK